MSVPTKKDPQEGSRTKVLESPVFVPFTMDSVLRKALQKMDDTLGECMNTPGVRFVEHCGGKTIVDLLRNSNPWARSLRCGRQGCVQCKSRDMLLMEEAERPIPEPGQPAVPRPSREDIVALPKFTSEGIGYVLECWSCRLQGRRFKYVGKSYRSGSQSQDSNWSTMKWRKINESMEDIGIVLGPS